MSQPEIIFDVPSLKRLWIHEVLRVYQDRLIDDGDRTWIYEALQGICERDLGEDFHKLLSRLDVDGDGIVINYKENHQPIHEVKSENNALILGFRVRIAKFCLL